MGEVQNISKCWRLDVISFCRKGHSIFHVGRCVGWSSDGCFTKNCWIQILIAFSYLDKNFLSSNNYRHNNSFLSHALTNCSKKLVSHVVARIWQTQRIKYTWISITFVRYRKLNKFFVRSFSDGTKYLKIINDKDRTFKNVIDKSDNCTFNSRSFNKNLPYWIDWQKFQRPCKQMIVVFRKHSFTWENLPQYYKLSQFFTIVDGLILPKQYIDSVEDAKIAKVTNENMNRGNRVHKDCCKVYGSLDSRNITAKVADKVENMLYCSETEISYVW